MISTIFIKDRKASIHNNEIIINIYFFPCRFVLCIFKFSTVNMHKFTKKYFPHYLLMYMKSESQR